eukprot:TRINITY_DN924_c0_g1_i1.p1 TRINITY_DN924_c0_g1~~TRINITY_DN924_c0_g1_i1.p1  ORF type:complete len:182 (+),score=60.59 TRINITY_DN924_c0_g1_i1:29-574(+)
MNKISFLLNPMSKEEEEMIFHEENVDKKKRNNEEMSLLTDSFKRRKITVDVNQAQNILGHINQMNNLKNENNHLFHDVPNLEIREVERLLKKELLLTDITHLLVLPQKIAALRLGISETILCKRFRQASNRKWPFRYITKIDRDLQNCTNEHEKKELMRMREIYLTPVCIMAKTNINSKVN